MPTFWTVVFALLLAAGIAGALAASHPLVHVQMALDGRLPSHLCR